MKKRTLWRSRWKRWQRFPANEKILIGSYLFGYFICWVKINYKIISSCIGSAPDFGVNFPGVRFRLLVFVLSHFVFFLFFILIQGKKFLRWGGEMEERSREHFTMFSCVILHQCNRCYNGCYHYEQSMYSLMSMT
jgi:hypothetical protein